MCCTLVTRTNHLEVRCYDKKCPRRITKRAVAKLAKKAVKRARK